MALTSLGQLDEAIDHFQQALRLDAADALTYGNLGGALLTRGRIREARTAFRSCLEHLSRDHSARAYYAQQLRRCDNLLVLESRLPAVLEGKDKPANAGECLEFARLCHVDKQHAAAVRLSEEASAAQPRLAEDVRTGQRFRAACYAALAAFVADEGSARFSAEERRHWREQARQWLKADLASWVSKQTSGAAADRALVRSTMTNWRANPDLAGLRTPGALEKLSVEERKDWLLLWNEVDALLERTSGR